MIRRRLGSRLPLRSARPARLMSIPLRITAHPYPYSRASAQHAPSVLHTSRGTVGRCVRSVGVGPGRPVSFSAGGFPRPALRTGRATSTASGSPCAHATTSGSACVCITRTRRPASPRSGSGAPVFTSDLRDQQFGCEHTGPLRHVTGFPGLRLLRVLRPIPPASAGNKPSRRPARCWPVREPGGWFPRSLSNRLTGSAPSYAPATSPRLRRRHSPWPPGRRHQPTKESPHTTIGVAVCVAARPRSARFEPLVVLRSFPSLVPHVRLSVLLAGPGPSGGADPSRLCQGCCPPKPPVPQGSGCPQLQRALCDKHEAVSFHHRTVRKRLVALDIRQPSVADDPSRGWANSPLVETRLPRAPGTPPRLRCPSPPHNSGSLQTVPCGHHPGSQQLVGSAWSQPTLSLQPGDPGRLSVPPSPRRPVPAQALGQQRPPAPPAIDCLIQNNTKISRQGRHQPASSQKTQDPAAEPR